MQSELTDTELNMRRSLKRRKAYHIPAMFSLVVITVFLCMSCSVCKYIIILHLINSSNERALFVPRERPIFSRIGSKKSPYFFRIGRLGASALCHCFSTIKAVDRKKYPNEKNTTSNKRNVKLLLDRTIRNIYGKVFKRLKSHASFIRCRIKRL